MGGVSILLGGQTWLQEIGYGQPGDVEVAHLYSQSGGGLHYAKFKLALPRNYAHPLLRKGTKVETFGAGGLVRLGSATLNEIDPANWEFTADGLFRRAEKVIAIQTVAGASPNLTYYYAIREIITNANADDGLGWNGFGTMPAAHYVDGPEEGRTLEDVLGEYCVKNGTRWGIDADDVPYMVTDPAEPTWALTPGVPLMPTSDTTSVSKLTFRYFTNDATPEVMSEIVLGQESFDGRHLRVVWRAFALTTTAAQSLAEEHFANYGVRVTYTEGITVRAGDLTSLGSVALDNWHAGLVVCGQRGLHHGVYDKFTGTLGKTITWVCGSTVYKDAPGGGTLEVYPMELSPRVLSRIITKLALVSAGSPAAIAADRAAV